MDGLCGERRWNVLVCEDVDGRDSLWPWRQGWRCLMPCCSGWRRPGETSTPWSIQPPTNYTPRHNRVDEQVEGWDMEIDKMKDGERVL